nr:MAG TPA: hypothetical protein [Caudoviricetes sp.]
MFVLINYYIYIFILYIVSVVGVVRGSKFIKD